MAQDNIMIANDVVSQLNKYYTKGVILVVSNPVDIITYKIAQWTGLPNGMVFGTGCILDSSRFVNAIADYVGLNIEIINGTIAGEHGETQIPIWSKVTVAGMPIEEYCSTVGLKFNQDEKNKIALNVKQMGTEIIASKGKTHYGIATCVCYIADAILNRRATISSVSSVLTGEYGVDNVALSLPSIIGSNGVEKRIVEHWDEKEFVLFKKSETKLLETLKIL
jgi:L-lactate dehydrogenase